MWKDMITSHMIDCTVLSFLQLSKKAHSIHFFIYFFFFTSTLNPIGRNAICRQLQERQLLDEEAGWRIPQSLHTR